MIGWNFNAFPLLLFFYFNSSFIRCKCIIRYDRKKTVVVLIRARYHSIVDVCVCLSVRVH